jgi:hypothetical protein
MSLCPYCKNRPKLKGRKTCGAPECQYKRHLETVQKYFNTYIRKTPRRVLSKNKNPSL